MKIVKIKFKSSFHSGEREGFLEATEEIIHSDTLFSAFCYNYLLLYGENELNQLIEKFRNNNPVFLISSMFPYSKEKLYFPVPLNQLPKEKVIKKIKYIEKDGFEKLLNGEKLEDIYLNYSTIPEKDGKTHYNIIENPRIGLSRLNTTPGENYFHFGEVFFEEGSGLFFVVDFKEPDFEKKFFATLRLMGDEGIGGDRSVGKGNFTIDTIDKFEIQTPSESFGCIILSLYLPQENELKDLKDGYYEIIERKGYIFSPYTKSLRKKSIRMFIEGSVFPSMKKGKIADVTPTEIFQSHNVYRYGFAFSLPCKIEVQNEN
ncbi:MAG TPA: type III-A CRISPR-associated RAMP protein Csm4 [bacterium]|nr:type III-A CRISPR-associated RAMP protein Csm4 [bacterium]HOM27669.1 type III-A CRISPR-associated RAMP protein Csm4 [bacterium]